jgi:hypothetical protein
MWLADEEMTGCGNAWQRIPLLGLSSGDSCSKSCREIAMLADAAIVRKLDFVAGNQQ